MAKKYWMGSEPRKCDICGGAITKQFVDGKTTMGPWGILCRACHKKVGVGLGLGSGQLYELKDERWEKIGG